MGRDADGSETVQLTVHAEGEVHQFEVGRGRNLRNALLDRGHSPYTDLTSSLNCGGRGICATCGVRIVDGEPSPEHWHDRAADRFGYPRLSCQITVEEPMTVLLVDDKRIWGGRGPTESSPTEPFRPLSPRFSHDNNRRRNDTSERADAPAGPRR
ncbi:Ferredoxin [Natranaeroarchaeum sulfidigenes]|uniref:Ferredoxin n=1 Tax=Natranaeroarchaeum sulfidigenes TaxID=2784880 RepID=A0A897MYY2_9EURY|nr:2Fe-2S iron-sulfur cluster binding domain-containing protein [Natranaeroarchaeum sulfidigenes]QSG03575.1 Ferredoxin [Natranaeroarchaeum sulfidigenes]